VTAPQALLRTERVPSQPRQAREGAVVAVAILAQLLVWVDGSVINLALPRLSDPVLGLGAGPGQLEWLLSGYAVSFGSLLLLGGALAERFGVRRMVLVGLVLLAGASTVAAMAPSATVLIIARGLMGVGSALLTPATLSLVVQASGPEFRSRAVALWSSAAGVGVALGPVVGGLLLSRYWWGSVFLINLPIAAVSIAGVLALVPEFRADQPRPLDLTGLMLSFTGLVTLVYGTIRGGQLVSFLAPEVLVGLVAGAELLVAFAVVQASVATPSFDVRFFRVREFAGGSIGLLLAFFTLSGSLFFAVQYLQVVRGLGPLDAGLIELGPAVGVVIGGQLAPELVRRSSNRLVVTGGMLLNALTILAFVTFDVDTPITWFETVITLQAVGIGLIMAPTTTAMLAALPLERSGTASAVISVMRQVGNAMGVAVLGSVLTAGYQTAVTPALARLPERLRESAGGSAAATRALAARLRSPALARLADEAFLQAMSAAVLYAAGFALVATWVLFRTFRRRRRRGRHL
jgi:EmrB/QacA subfamily drug resistance transporter